MTFAFSATHLWAGLAGRLQDMRTRRAAARELAALDPAERARVLADFGLSEHELTGACATPHALDDMQSQALASLGVDVKAFRAENPLWQRDMARLCLACEARGRCRNDLAEGRFAGHYAEYCPNAESLDEISARV